GRLVVGQAVPLVDAAADHEDGPAGRPARAGTAGGARALALREPELDDRVSPGPAGLLRPRPARQRQVDRDALGLAVDVQHGRARVLELARQREEVRGALDVAAVEGGEPTADDPG